MFQHLLQADQRQDKSDTVPALGLTLRGSHGGTTAGTTANFTPSSGDVLIAAIGTRKASAFSAQAAILDSLGLTWTQIGDFNGPDSNARMRLRLMWAQVAANPVSMNVSATCADSDNIGCAVISIAGMATDFSSLVSATDLSGDPSILLAGTPARMIAIALAQADNGFTPPSGYTELYDLAPSGTSMRLTCIYDLFEPANPAVFSSANTRTVAAGWEIIRAAAT
jgi:hypothetical protein